MKLKLPNREQLLGNRFLRPFARHLASPNLWRFNRRSVPRGVAVGLFCGVLIPVAHTPLAVLAAAPARANAIVAAVATWAINPVTLGPLLFAGHWVGVHIVGKAPVLATSWPWTRRFLEVTGTTLVGLLPIALSAAAVGYLLAIGVWRLRTLRRWRRRGRDCKPA